VDAACLNPVDGPSVARAIERVLGAGAATPIALDRRQRALLCLLVAGYTDASVARRLRVSPRTVTYLVRALMDELGVANRFQLGIVLGLRAGADQIDQAAGL
jgi:DNA-binding NarL/FixJ family response regulator